MYDYACEFYLFVDRSRDYGKYDPYDVNFISENDELLDMVEFRCDFYFDHPDFDKLESGDYWVYARGIAEFESDRDWESGIEEGHFILGVDKLVIKRTKDR